MNKLQMVSFVGQPCTGKTTTFNVVRNVLHHEKHIMFLEEPSRTLMESEFPGMKIEDMSPHDYAQLQTMIFEIFLRYMDIAQMNNKILVTDSSPLENVYVYSKESVPPKIRKSMENILKSKMNNWMHNIILFSEPLPFHKDGLRHEDQDKLMRIGSAIEDEIFKQNIPFTEMEIFYENAVKNIQRRAQKAIMHILAVQNLFLYGKSA